jgi:hypothetical protein
MNPRRILLMVPWLVAFAAIAQTIAIWMFCHSSWTPIERHYLSAYFWSSLPLAGPSTVEVRLIWKTGRHRKQQLATDSDAVASDDGTGMLLSQSARDAGWKALIEGPPQQVSADLLSQDLAGLAFEGQSFGDLLLMPEISALVTLCTALGTWYLLIGFFRALSTELAWRLQYSTFQGSISRFFEECAALAREVRSGVAGLHRGALRRAKTHSPCAISVVEPPRISASFALPLFGVYSGTSGGYLWSEKDEIKRSTATTGSNPRD